jgi:hypothetical protein
MPRHPLWIWVTSAWLTDGVTGNFLPHSNPPPGWRPNFLGYSPSSGYSSPSKFRFKNKCHQVNCAKNYTGWQIYTAVLSILQLSRNKLEQCQWYTKIGKLAAVLQCVNVYIFCHLNYDQNLGNHFIFLSLNRWLSYFLRLWAFGGFPSL